MQGITDCTGKTIKLGDYVQTPSGKVIKVEGGMVLTQTLYNAATCKKVDGPKGDHKPSPKEVGDFNDQKASLAAAQSDTDCVVWGS